MRRRRALSALSSDTTSAADLHPDIQLADDSDGDNDITHQGTSHSSSYSGSGVFQWRRPASALSLTLASLSLHDLWQVLLALCGQVALEVYVMALGLGRWFAGGLSTTKEENVDGEQAVGMETKDGKRKTKRRRRRKVEDGSDNGGIGAAAAGNGQFPGMVNLSGTLCYMNSVLQAFASISSLVTHLEHIVALAVEVDVPTPVTDTLLDVLNELNTPHRRSPPALRPHNLLAALQPLPAIRRLLSTREQQDAHELFIVLAEAVSDEAVKIAAEVARSRGFGEVLSLQGYVVGKNGAVPPTPASAGRDELGASKRKRVRGVAQPWEGLMSRRRACKRCGWSEAVRMDTLGGMELPVPLHGDVTLDACIAEYLSPEHLSDVTCEMCSLRQTLAHYQTEVERLSAPASASASESAPRKYPNSENSTQDGSAPSKLKAIASGSYSALDGLPTATATSLSSNSNMTNSRKKRAKDAKRVESRLREMLDSASIQGFGEPTLPPTPTHTAPLPIKWQTVRTESYRQACISRPPQSLRLHFIRSEYTNYGALVKKTARVNFPVILDLTKFVSRGIWEEEKQDIKALASASFNSAATLQDQDQDQDQDRQEHKSDAALIPTPTKRVLYRLESAILHYGYTHSSGHFICLRRKPVPREKPYRREDGSVSESYVPSRASKSCADGCRCEDCLYFGQVREPTNNAGLGKGWLRISDADVEEVGEEALYEARGAVFMLFYEKVGDCPPSPGSGASSSSAGTGSRGTDEQAQLLRLKEE